MRRVSLFALKNDVFSVCLQKCVLVNTIVIPSSIIMSQETLDKRRRGLLHVYHAKPYVIV